MNSSNPGSSVSPPRPRFRRLRRVVLALALIGTLAAMFYAVEDWRGRAAWEKCKRELEAKGMPTDWASYVPTNAVADADNFFKAPKMQEWFVRNPTKAFNWNIPNVAGSNPVVVAEVKVILPGAAEDAGQAYSVFQLNDAATAERTEKLVLDAIGPHVYGAQNYTFVARPAENIKPLQIVLRADHAPSQKELAPLFPPRALAVHDFSYVGTSALSLQAAGSNLFRVLISPPPQSAAAFIAATDKMQGDLGLLQTALKRPYARMDGDYSSPVTQPVPNFVQMRTAAQLFSERAQCHLMLGQPEEALKDLTVIHDLCRILECRPSGPTTLVGPMINVAIRGLYTQTVADGIRLGAWREPQLAALEGQLRQVDLSPQVRGGFREAGAAFCHHLETFTAAEFTRLLPGSSSGKVYRGAWDYATDFQFWCYALTPRGWRYQNMVRGERAHAMMDDEFNLTNGTIDPGKAGEIATWLGNLRSGPYTYFVASFIPNYIRAGMATGYQQTMANEALIACALERYHMAEGKYPETLGALAPRFLEKVPKDIIGGKPLVYHRTEDGKFMLYSVGWNQKDDGGLTSRGKSGDIAWEQGDWVWLNCTD